MGKHSGNQVGEVVNIRETEHPVTGFKAQLLHQLNKAGAQFPDCYKAAHETGKASMFLPINGDPYVVLFKGEEVVTRVFKPDNQASGTDAMRARILAERFFEGVTQ